MMSSVYLSYPISEQSPLYGNATGVRIKKVQVIENGDSCNTMSIHVSTHTGTHVDVPQHFDPTGKTITDYPSDFWIFNRVDVIDISKSVQDRQLIEPDIFPDLHFNEPELILFYTGYGRYRDTDRERYTLTPPGFSHNVFNWLKDRFPSVRCIGMDLISISSFCNREEGRKAHKAFLSPDKGDPIVLIEDMKLDSPCAFKQIVVAPLFIENADGSPCTIIGFK